MFVEVLMLLLESVYTDYTLGVPGLLDSRDILKICRLNQAMKNCEMMSLLRIRCCVLSFFGDLKPRLGYFAHGSVRLINNSLFQIVRFGENLTSLHYKVCINPDGTSLTVKRYGFFPYEMRIDLFKTTTSVNLSGRIFCTCLDSGDLIIANFKYMCSSPTLFNEVVMYIKKNGVKGYRFDFNACH